MTEQEFNALDIGQTIRNIAGVKHRVAERIDYKDGKVGYIVRTLDGDRAYAGTPDVWSLTPEPMETR